MFVGSGCPLKLQSPIDSMRLIATEAYSVALINLSHA